MSNGPEKQFDMFATQTEKKPEGLTGEEAWLFVQNCLAFAEPEQLHGRCIDGRYGPDAGAISMAGGDLGLLAIALAARRKVNEDLYGESEAGRGLTRDFVLDAVYKIVGGKEKFHYHSDAHTYSSSEDTDSVERFKGCGHCKMLLNEPEKYGLTSEDVVFITSALDDLDTHDVPPTVLHGAHKERAVFIVQRVHAIPDNGEDPVPITFQDAADERTPVPILSSQSFTSKNREGELVQAFVYNRGPVNIRLFELARAFKRELEPEASLPVEDAEKEVLFTTLKALEQQHLDNTREALAGDLPIFVVSVVAVKGEPYVKAGGINIKQINIKNKKIVSEDE